MLNTIGHLFRRLDGSAWGVNVGLFPWQDAKSLRFSMAPVLVRKRLFNPVSKNQPGGWREDFIVHDASKWTICKVADCPAYETPSTSELDQFCFLIKLENGKKVYLPQFELARALFFHDGYMARASLEPSQLVLEYDVQVDWENDKAEIHVMPYSHYPVKSLNEPSARNILSWILIDQEARNSFNSIAQYQLRTGQNSGVYRKWNFQFDPPPFKGVGLSLRGLFDAKTQSMFVFEIVGIRNIGVKLPELIE